LTGLLPAATPARPRRHDPYGNRLPPGGSTQSASARRAQLVALEVGDRRRAALAHERPEPAPGGRDGPDSAAMAEAGRLGEPGGVRIDLGHRELAERPLGAADRDRLGQQLALIGVGGQLRPAAAIAAWP
jgi:hypothetical protein